MKNSIGWAGFSGSGGSSSSSSGGGFDWGSIIGDVIKTVPTLFNHGNTTNQYSSAPYTGQPVTPYPANYYSAQPQTTQAGMNTTTLLALGLGGLVLFKMMKKKK